MNVVNVYSKIYKNSIPSGYMGQIVEWNEVVTEAHDIEECRAMLRDALQERSEPAQTLNYEL